MDATPSRLVLIYQQGCSHCEAAKPEHAAAVARLGNGITGLLADIDKVKTSFPVTVTPTLLLQLQGAFYVTDPSKVPLNASSIVAWVTLCLRDHDLKLTRARVAAAMRRK